MGGKDMKKTMWGILSLLLACTLILSACGGAGGTSAGTSGGPAGSGGAAAGKYKAALVSNTPGQSWMIMGNAFSEWIKDDMELSVEPGTDYGNIVVCNDGDAAFGFSTQISYAKAIEGTGFFAENGGKQENVRLIASFYKMYVRAFSNNPNIKTLADLKGKDISFGRTGEVAEEFGEILFKAVGLEPGDYTKHNLPFADAVELLKNNQLDALLIGCPTPFAIIDDLAISSTNAHILEIPESACQDLRSQWQGFEYMEYTLDDGWMKPAKLYTPIVQVNLIAGKHVSDEEAYLLAKTIYEHFDDLCGIVANNSQMGGAQYLTDNPANISWHPGAEKYFKEIGILK
jgi:TRAP transporter TAXI family solute receptor